MSTALAAESHVENPQSRFLERVLEPPSYGWTRDGRFYKPTDGEVIREWLSRMNVFANRKNWLSFTGWFFTILLMPFGVVFLARYRSLPLLVVGFFYSMFWLGTHGTVWLHRYSTHRAFTFTNNIYRFLCRNLSIKIVADETYVISHHCHHAFSETPGDPYNVNGGFLYVFLAGEIHQPIAKNLSREDYVKLTRLLNHTGVHINSYEQYQYWGSLCHPAWTYAHYLLNWAFWYGAFYLIGGHALATVIFGFSSVWGVGIRTFNWDGHGGGKDKRRDGIDFFRTDHSINQNFPGFLTGEWHNNHHLFPNGVRAGFLPYQMDTAYGVIWIMKVLGGVPSWRDYRERFYKQYYEPYLAGLAARGAEGRPQQRAQSERPESSAT